MQVNIIISWSFCIFKIAFLNVCILIFFVTFYSYTTDYNKKKLHETANLFSLHWSILIVEYLLFFIFIKGKQMIFNSLTEVMALMNPRFIFLLQTQNWIWASFFLCCQTRIIPWENNSDVVIYLLVQSVKKCFGLVILPWQLFDFCICKINPLTAAGVMLYAADALTTASVKNNFIY